MNGFAATNTLPSFSVLQGLTLTAVTVNDERTLVRFTVDDGRVFALSHQQECCEDVVIESVTGDLADLLNSPILLAEEASSDTPPADVAKPDYAPESQTWTFYKLRTLRGSVDIRWFGSSNGYYSESVTFAEESRA